MVCRVRSGRGVSRSAGSGYGCRIFRRPGGSVGGYCGLLGLADRNLPPCPRPGFFYRYEWAHVFSRLPGDRHVFGALGGPYGEHLVASFAQRAAPVLGYESTVAH